MTNDDLILQKLDALQEEVRELRRSQRTYQELFDDMNPLLRQAFQVMLKEMSYIEDAFQLEDLYLLVKRGVRNVRNLAYMLDQLENMVELWRTMEPMMESTVHNLIRYLGTLEVKGVFRTYEAMLQIRGQVAEQYGPEDIEGLYELARTDGVMPIVRRTATFNRHRQLILALFKHPPARQILFRSMVG